MADVNFGSSANWLLGTDSAFVLMRAGCLEALARIDNDGRLQPSLATSWTQTAPTAWDFKLREGVSFQDGQPLNAKAVVSALQHALEVAVPARTFSPKQIKSVEAVDDMTVRITTPEPSVLVPYRVASPNSGILSPTAYKGMEDAVNPIGTCTGPFKITASVPDQGLTLKRNEAYWGGKVALEGAEIHFIPDSTVRATQVRTGEAQISRQVPVSVVEQLRSAQDVVIEQAVLPRTTALYLNNKKPPLNDVRVRQAIQSALDLEAIVAAVYEGAAMPAIGPFTPGEPWAPATAPASFDADRAKALLAEAGVAPGSVTLGLIAYNEKGELKDLAAVIQEQLAAIGIGVTIRQADYPAIEPDLLSGNFDMALLSRGHLGDIADPIGFLTADYTCGGGYNISHYCDPEIEAALKTASAAGNDEERFAIYRQIAEKLQKDAVDVFIIHEQGIDVVSKGPRNYQVHPLSQYALTATLATE